MKKCVICGKTTIKVDKAIQLLSKTFANNRTFCSIECYNEYESQSSPNEPKNEGGSDD